MDAASRHSRRRPSRPLRPIAIFAMFLVFGLVLIVGGWFERSRETPIAGGMTTVGTVVKVRQTSSGRGGNLYKATVSFIDTNGVSHQFTGPSNPHKPKIGEEATVSYDPRNPARAHNLSHPGWKLPLIFGVTAVSFSALVLGLLGYVRIRWPDRGRHSFQAGESDTQLVQSNVALIPSRADDLDGQGR